MNDKLQKLIEKCAADPKYREGVFEGHGIYFVFLDGQILTISQDAGESVHGWFPQIVSHPTGEREAYLKKVMAEYDICEDFFVEATQEYGAGDVESWFEDQEDEEALEVCRQLMCAVEGEDVPFYDFEDLVTAMNCMELDNGLYYIWEGEYILFYENICEVGLEPGAFDSMTDEDWISILENLESRRVTAD